MRDQRPTPFLVTLCLAMAACPAPAGADGPAAGSVLHLRGGDFVAGTLFDSGKAGRLRWQGSAFTAPFDFRTVDVNALHAPAPARPPRPEGDFSFTLAGGDVLHGSLAALDESEAVLDVPKVGRLHVRRGALHRIERLGDNADLVYLGPAGLSGWQAVAPGDAVGWRDESGDLASDADGAAVRGDFRMPARASVEFEVSWKVRPDFVLAMGVGDEAGSARRAFRFEVWEGDLVVTRETDEEADAASVAKVAAGPGRVRLRAYLDQDRGRVVVVSGEGETLADLTVAGPRPRALPGLLLENKRGDLRLERLRVSRWNGVVPRPAKADRSSLQRLDGSSLNGRVTGYDAGAKAFLVRDDGDESRVPADKVAVVSLSPPGDAGGRAVRAVLQDGTRLGGELDRVEGGRIWVSSPDIKGPVGLPADGLRSLVVLRRDDGPVDRPRQSGHLEAEGVRLSGRLVDGREGPGESCLVWKPLASDTASPIRPGLSGRVVYKEPPPPPTPSQLQAQAQARMHMQMQVQQRVVINGQVVMRAQPAGGLQGFVRGFATSGPSSAPGKRSLYLRTGDVIPSEVTKIDEAGVTFRSPISDSTFVPHDKVKAVELAPAAPASGRLNKPKRERLLTLPRMQKASPPTHMVRSRNGDYLRGRLVGMDARTLQVEVRLENKSVPRDRVARIIWLHPDEAGGPDAPARPRAPAAPPAPVEGTRVQAVLNDGIRLTFHAGRDEAGTLSGKSDVLGACRVRLADVDHLLIGPAIEQEAARLAYQQWTLKNAPEPKAAQADGGASPDGRPPGTESAMVGKPAPDFTLELLGGKSFRLSESKGKVVVLDFWATWCGPCLQAMPQVDRVTREFKDQGVTLVAVNLQEAPKEIAAMLERHKLDLTVALDRDGVVADRYGATAIPQTVVVGPDGTVARLFVGGGPHLGDQLREALLPLLPGAASKPK